MTSSILWLEPLQAFPPVDLAWGEDSPFPGLLAAGGAYARLAALQFAV